MKSLRVLFLVPLVALAAYSTLQSGQKDEPTPPRKIHRLDPRFDKLIGKDAVVETIARGFIWTEGTAWNKEGKFLLFSDIPNNVVHKWQDGKLSVFVKPSGYTGKTPRGGKPGDEPGSNGLRFDAQGRLTLCEHGDRRVTRIEKDGKKTVLADNYMGKKLNSPNDLALHPNGDVYFTDPPYGLAKGDKRGYLLVDEKGDVFSLSRYVTDIKGKEFKAFMAPLDPATLPDSEHAKILHVERASKAEKPAPERSKFLPTELARKLEQGTPEPEKWTLTFAEKSEPTAGRASIWGNPFAGTPIDFDDLVVTAVK